MEKIINPDNLSDEEIEVFVARVKILVINDFNQILLCKVDGVYYFIGGHIEGTESFSEALTRELRQETGIEEQFSPDITPFFVNKYYNKNHYGTSKKGLSIINYFCLKTNQPANLENMNLDESELNRGFSLEYVDLDGIESVLLDDSNNDGIAIAEEMLEVIRIYKKISRTKKKNKSKKKGKENV